MGGLHQLVFQWPYSTASSVIVTGTFDGWSSSLHLTRGADGTFTGKVDVDYGHKITYKFIVDGNWTTLDSEPTERDPAGNLNNVYIAPQKPLANGQANLNGSLDSKSTSTLSDLAATIVAADGTSSALQYVTSSVGGAIKGVIGVDPWSPVKIGFESPRSEPYFDIPEVPKSEETTENSPISPIIPMPIVPVNAPENTIASSPSASPDVPAAEEPSTHRLMIPPTPPEVPSKDIDLRDAEGSAEIQAVDTEKTFIPAEVIPAPVHEQVAVVPTDPKVTQDAVPTPIKPASELNTEAVHAVETKADGTIPPMESTSTEAAPGSTRVDAAVPPAAPESTPEPAVAHAKVDQEALAASEAKTESVAPVAPAEEGKVDAADLKAAEPTPEAGSAEQAQNAGPATPTKMTSAASSPTTPTRPSTPSKKHAFPLSGSPKSTFTDSPPSSILGSRKKKGSIFRRISLRGIFGGDKDKEKK